MSVPILMEKFLGIWKLEIGEGHEEVMKRLGVNYMARKMSHLMKPTLYIRDVGNSYYGIRREGCIKSIESFFKLGERFNEVTPDYREVISIIFIKNGIMKHEQLGPGAPVHIERVIIGDALKSVSSMQPPSLISL